jgi:predicted nucleic acid-binding protein
MDVSREDYFGGIELMKEIGLDPNDSLAAQLMKNEGIREIYSFDRDFDRVKEIKRIHSLE